ncbi:MAG: peptide chain release factor 1, partial [Candidatus Nitrosopelagicus sp.]|nr:peptide chain release factor 1 [Candidatus Nitrosopelagicus sp.]
QSAKRFQKLREMELQYYFNRVAEITREYFIDIYQVKGLIVSGPGPTKEEFVNKEYLEYRLQNNIIATIDASYSGAEGIREAFAKCSDILSNFRMVEEKKIIERLFQEINTNTGLGSYGLKEVIEMLKNNIAGTIIISDDINMSRIEKTCKRCSNIDDEFIEQGKRIARKTEMKNQPCSECKAMDSEIIDQDLIDYIALNAAQTGTKVEVVSGKTEHGTMLGSLGNIAAILRYNPNRV